jgi:hypothetical protein
MCLKPEYITDKNTEYGWILTLAALCWLALC